MKNHSPIVRHQPYAEQQRRASAPMLNNSTNNNRLSSPPFALANHQSRHSSFNPHHIQQQQHLALNQPPPPPSPSLCPPQPQIHRLSIAERFMSSTPSISDLPSNNYNKQNDPPPTSQPPNSDTINDTDYVHPHSVPTTTFTNSTNCGQPFDNSKQFEDTNRSSWAPSLQPPTQPKRHSRKAKKMHADQQQSNRRPPKSTTTLPSYGQNLDHMEKSALSATTTPTVAAATAGNQTMYTKGDRQHEKNIMNQDMPLEGFWYCHRGCLLLCIFFFILVLGFLLFLVWPRVPLLRIEGASVVSPVEMVQTQQGWMENVMFTTSWLVNVTVDNRQNYIPTRLNKVQVIVKDAVTNALVGKGTHNDDNMDWVLMDGISTMSVLVTVNYQARDMSDTTLLDLAHACHRTAADLPATSLPLHFWFTLYMFGFDWLGFTPTIIATPASSGFFCPV